jgi:hypothetical protein
MRYRNRFIPLLVCLGLAACGAGSSHGLEANVDDGEDSKGSASPGQGAAGMGDTPDAAAAGNDSQAGGLPKRSAREVYLSPADISTAVNVSTLELWVDGLRGDVGVESLEELSAAVSVVTWPELQAIASVVTVVDASQAGDRRAHVTIAPADTLESRWYAVVVGALPIGFQWWNAPGSRGEKVARFRTDSKPVIARVTRCDKGGVRHLAVGFSEVISSADAYGISVSGASCEPVIGGAKSVDVAYLDCSIDGEVTDLTLTFDNTAPVLVDKDAWRAVGDSCFDFVRGQLAP